VRAEVLEQLHVQLLVLLDFHLHVVPEHADLFLSLMYRFLLRLAGDQASHGPAALLGLLLELLHLRVQGPQLLGHPAILVLQLVNLLKLLP